MRFSLLLTGQFRFRLFCHVKFAPHTARICALCTKQNRLFYEYYAKNEKNVARKSKICNVKR